MIDKQKLKEAVEVLNKVNFKNYSYFAGQDCELLDKQQDKLIDLLSLAHSYLNGKFEHSVLVPLSFYESCKKTDKLEQEIVRLRKALEKIENNHFICDGKEACENHIIAKRVLQRLNNYEEEDKDA